jgi:hypothetical protein
MELSWATEPLRDGWVASRTRIVFDDVVDGGRPDEGGLELGELEDSDRLLALVEQGFDKDLRHFRIAFDEHGKYDVICRRLRIEHEPRRPATQPVPPADAAGGEDRPAGYYPSVRTCPFDDRALLFAFDTVDGRLTLECMACGRVYDAPDDLSRVRPPRPDSMPRSRPATLDEIERAGWARFLPA